MIWFRPVFGQSIQGTNESINIGLLITEDPSENELMREAVDVVNLVLNQANESGEVGERQFKLFVESVDGNWGGGSKRAVDLISKYGTTALLGFVDGRSAHLIEQVCTKAQVPFVSTYSPDPTLSRINIPWFFSTMPHADQQAKVLADEIMKNHQNDKIAVVSSDDYDQDFIQRSFLQEIEDKSSRLKKTITYQAGEKDFTQITSEISEFDAKVIAFFGSPIELENLISEMEMYGIVLPVYIPIIDLKNEWLQNMSNPVFTLKAKNWDMEKKKKFYEYFYLEYGYRPGVYASYVHDGTEAIIDAIRSNGLASAQIQDALTNMSLQGINGIISFDNRGMINQSLTMLKLNNQ
ncbi:MAG: ABC transporter substrate-binding protein [Balneolaceae bacterium]|nr:ABC transporter substrate-binding protein [Balneolaceae bacterium]